MSQAKETQKRGDAGLAEAVSARTLIDRTTNLPGKEHFLVKLSHCLEQCKRFGCESFVMLFIDLDRFKMANKAYGHEVGDKLLLYASRRIASSVRGVDTVARFGGDEFAVLIENLPGVRDAMEMARRIVAEMALPFSVDGHTLYTSASVGMVVSAERYDDGNTIVRDAEIAMYQAKHQGGGNVKVFTPRMHAESVSELALENDLHRALDEEEFEVDYQPIVSVQGERTVGFEALLRWNHRKRGYIPPSDFIPVAEATRLIVPIGQWLVDAVCSQVRAWRDQFGSACPFYVSVNISAMQFLQPSFVEMFLSSVREHGVDGNHLKVEITESVLMENPSSAERKLNRLKEAGLEILMDDFGTGYSSLSYLHRFPIDAIKIDRSFIKDIETKESASLVRTIISLAENLDLWTVAEGVEDGAQLDALKDLECDCFQGFHFSRPVPAGNVEGFLSKVCSCHTAGTAGLTCESDES